MWNCKRRRFQIKIILNIEEKKIKTIFRLIVSIILFSTITACNRIKSGTAVIPQTSVEQPETNETGKVTTLEKNTEISSQNLSENSIDSYSYYPVFDKIEKIYLGDGYEDAQAFILSNEERSELWRLMCIDTWVVASGLPESGFPSEFYIDEVNQVWFFNKYSGQALIVPSIPDKNGEKICYFAPANVITDIMSFIKTLTPAIE